MASLVPDGLPTTTSRPIIRAQQSEDTIHLRNGDLIEVWGNIIEWDDDCVTLEMSESWRHEGDPLCDAAVDLLWPNLFTGAGADLLAVLEAHVAEHPVVDAAHVFLKAVSQRPPEDICATESDIRTACEFHLDHILQISQALMYFSLVGGFASPRIVQTLHSVSYLVSQSPGARPEAVSEAQLDRTYARLVDTSQFLLDVLGYTSSTKLQDRLAQSTTHLMPGGEGWKSVVRVRMLHAVARRRARAKLEKESGIDSLPINQEDVSATLASFSVVPLLCLDRMHLTPELAHARAYLALWRHVGFFLGVSPSILRRHFADLRPATKFLASTVIHLFSPPPPGFKALPPPAPLVLQAIATRGLLRMSLAYSSAAARLFLGDVLAAHVGVPHASRAARMWLHCALYVQRLVVLFSKYYPRKRWGAKRRAMTREGLITLVQATLNKQRMSFKPRGADEKELCDVTETVEVEENSEGRRMFRRLTREVLAELLGVIFLLTTLAVSVPWCGMIWVRMVLS
ncbi:hypothetical protein BV25DRAFT_623323 [Artomyces pyxidatus]|uniref:Uncharacterized protein n=1 Tax=Artomyces pyxidatus TaxID=48021 RepID=A0ACB8T3Y0_9AGAM|nr:hypothetical protein BV25DRAFT_623323 [Artomyces pyxidatus]